MKCEEVYLKAHHNVTEARTGIDAYMGFYNEERPHQALEYRTPREVFEEGSVNTKTSGPEDQEGGRTANDAVVSLPGVGRREELAGVSLVMPPSLAK